MARCFAFGVVVLLSLAGCDRPAGKGPVGAGTPPDSSTIATQQFQVRGVIKEVKPGAGEVTIRHEEVPNYMPAMTMPFDVQNPKELAGLKAGDAVAFRLLVTPTNSWIDQIQKLSAGDPTQLPSRSAIRLARNVDPLQPGDPLPEYHFTNELGKAVSTSSFKGQALAITFIFTRCPLPNFCPRMSTNFEETQKKLMAMKNAPANWHLLTISFDPDFDTPEILKAYSERFEADPKHWSFLTGELIDITAIAEQFGQTFWREEGALNHNLRTAVIDANGRVQRIFLGNLWTPDEVATEITKAATVGK